MNRHPNAPWTIEGKRRACESIDAGVPIAHVARNMGISRQTLTRWYGRWVFGGITGLEEGSSRPRESPNKTPDDIEHMVLDIRREEQWGPARISALLDTFGYHVAPSTVHRILERHGQNRLADLDRQAGNSKREIQRYEYEHPGEMIHVDIKKVGRIPKGGGWKIHGRGTDEARASKRVAAKPARVGYGYIHAAVDDYSRLAYVEVLNDEKGATAAAFWLRAVMWFRLNGIHRIERVLTDNGSPYRSHVFAAATDSTSTVRRRTKPYTPRTNGKVERFNRIMGDEWLNVRAYDSDEDRTAWLAHFVNRYNDERAHSALGYKPPSSRLPGDYHPISEQPAFLPEPPMGDEVRQPTLFDEHGDPAV